MLPLIAITFAFIQGFGCFEPPDLRLSSFDVDLLQSLSEDQSGNIVISPVCVKYTLCMLLEGAVGDTADEIKTTLRLPPICDIFRKKAEEALKVNTTKVVIRNANALFLSRKLLLQSDYDKVAIDIYSADAVMLNFSNPKTSVETISLWVKMKSKGVIFSITNIHEGLILPSTNMILTNFLYFKANWKYSFDINSTRNDCFISKGVCRNVTMMDIQAQLNYAFVDDLNAHALELPLQDENYSTLLIVPKHPDTSEVLIRDLQIAGIPEIYNMMEIKDVLLTMPKFTIDCSVNLTEALKKVGINSLFSQSANLSGIFESAKDAYANSVYQSMYVNIDEVGTEVSSYNINVEVTLITNRVILKVDRPFLFFIRNKELDLNLFEGKIEDPTEFIEAVTKLSH